jgi:hypothetical protein
MQDLVRCGSTPTALSPTLPSMPSSTLRTTLKAHPDAEALTNSFSLIKQTSNKITTCQDVSIQVSSGVLQLDPASSPFFAHVLSPALKAAAAVLKNGLLFAYVDDVTIVGPAEQVAAASKPLNHFSSIPAFALTPPTLSSTPWTFRTLQAATTTSTICTVTRCSPCSWHADRHSSL